VKKAIKVIGAVLFPLFFIGCSVTVIAPTETKVKAENDLANLTVEIGTSSASGVDINLYSVQIGDDVTFSSILSGTVTNEKVTSQSGTVDIVIGEADVISVFGTKTFSNITGMSTYITKDKTNTVVFDSQSASVILNKLAKLKTL
jgi:hypothetical protein